jgi:uncharacterized protein
MIATDVRRPGSRGPWHDGPVSRILVHVVCVVALVGCGDPTTPADGSGGPPAKATFETDAGAIRTGSLDVADSDGERERGLMDRESLGRDNGMVFVFDEPTTATFWMKDTEIPLSIAFWGADGRVMDMFEMTPCRDDPCRTYAPDTQYTRALEMNEGWFADHGIEIGDSVELSVDAG